MTKQLLHSKSHVGIPPEIAVCPYCNRPISVGFESFEQNDNGSWSATEVEVECATELDMLSAQGEVSDSEWAEFRASHSDMPYGHMLPGEVQVTKWVNEHYYFDLDDEDKPGANHTANPRVGEKGVRDV